MTELHKALMAFWSEMGIPVYLAGCVDNQAQFPYLTVDIAEGALMADTFLTATSWHRRGDTEAWTRAMTERLGVMEAAKQAVPPGGKMLRYNGGYVIIRRNDANFLSYVTDPEDARVIGGRISVEVQFFGSN